MNVAQSSVIFSSTVSKLVQRKLFWVFLVGFAFFTPIYRSVIRPLPEAAAPLFEVPAFSLTDENGHTFSSSSLSKKFSVVFFHFSRCPSICPKMMETAQSIEKRVRGLGQHVAILSITIDPTNDNPETLFKEARKYHANPFVWKFLTGTTEQIQSVTSAFKVPFFAVNEEVSLGDVVHSGSFFLLDNHRNVRGIYKNDKSDINRMMIELGLMINQTRDIREE